MIGMLFGELMQKSPSDILINVGGVGYNVHVPLSTYSKLPDTGNQISIQIHTHVREDQISLFGFWDSTEREMFIRLISISGVGPKLALSILSSIGTNDLETAISSGEASRLQLIPGVGKKTSERIIIELKDKIKIKTKQTGKVSDGIYDDALSALINFGYPRAKAASALNKIQWQDEMSLENMIKLAFKELQ